VTTATLSSFRGVRPEFFSYSGVRFTVITLTVIRS
jgi:hypothetical protein